MTTEWRLPRLYAIIDAAMFNNEKDALPKIMDFAHQLRKGGATLFQYRNKEGDATAVLSHARELQRLIGSEATFILNDRADLCLACGASGVHLGQEDLSVEGARCMLGENTIVGVSTHNLKQVLDANQTTADYIAVGPVFPTASKCTPEPVVGLQFVQDARRATSRPLVAIGGINRSNCRSVIEAGADSVAVIRDLQGSPQKRVEEFLEILG